MQPFVLVDTQSAKLGIKYGCDAYWVSAGSYETCVLLICIVCYSTQALAGWGMRAAKVCNAPLVGLGGSTA